MKRPGVKKLRIVVCALAGQVFAGSAAAQHPPAARPSEKKNLPTVADAQKFLDEVENRYFDLTNKANHYPVGW